MKPTKLLFFFLLFSATPLIAQTFQVESCHFEIINAEEQTVRICHGNYADNLEDGSTFAVIPSSVTYQGVNYTVVEIGKRAYWYCRANVITIPNTIKRICDEAFMYCFDIEEINLSEGLEVIGDRAFGSTYVHDIHIPASVRYLGKAPFMWAGNVTITVDAANPSYDSRQNCNAIIETATNTLIQGGAYTRIPESVTEIGVNAFGCYEGLESIDIPASVTTLCDSAFMWCYNLEKVELHDGLKSIGDKVFMTCPKLKELTIPKSVEHIGKNGIFANSNLILSVEEGNPFYDSREDCNAVIVSNNDSLIQGSNFSHIPATVKQIGNGAFLGCLGLKDICLPEGLTTVCDSAFHSCYNLSEVQLPGTLTSIGNYGFYYCAFSGIDLPEGLHTIGSYAFALCKNLKTIRLPGSITMMKEATFNGCDALESITILAATPPEVASAKDFLPENKFVTTILTVPENSMVAYRNHEVWGRFKNIVECNPTAIHSLQKDNNKLSNSHCFDLTGRRLTASPTKGVYIENGKKKAVK